MSRYIGMLFDAAGRVVRVEPFDAISDAAARDQGILMQLLTREATAFEVWRGAIKIAAFYGRRPAWSSRSRVGPAVATELADRSDVASLATVRR